MKFIKYPTLTLAVDFDNTIVEEKREDGSLYYPEIGPLRSGAKLYLNKLHKEGHYIIIWTCREGEHALRVEKYLRDNDIGFHKVNENEPERILHYGINCRKVSADLYIDDKGILGIPSWKKIYRIVRKKAKKIELI